MSDKVCHVYAGGAEPNCASMSNEQLCGGKVKWTKVVIDDMVLRQCAGKAQQPISSFAMRIF